METLLEGNVSILFNYQKKLSWFYHTDKHFTRVLRVKHFNSFYTMHTAILTQFLDFALFSVLHGIDSCLVF